MKLLSPPGAAVQRYRVAGQAIGEITVTLEESAALLSIVAEGAGLTPRSELAITAYALGQPILEETITGKPGEIVSTTLRAAAIDRIRITSGPASLVDLCWYSVLEHPLYGWEPLADTLITRGRNLVGFLDGRIRHPDRNPHAAVGSTDDPVRRAHSVPASK